ncbi:Lar family restriction alleviation protein [Paraburkholderia unamae]|uniref:Restriction alleviation protein Lar n=1 Tax=Paraburkholderia unamae TaxID=219649 RepID=A0ABX5KU69_9BURK|nr:Lar family restriction alleviation protein [Paraburkholderia unamae]PVX85804.1 restriction alleviation protein Lar [Paraburkholderia unamae]
MYEQLIPCDHCGGRPKVGRSQRLLSKLPNPQYDYTEWGRLAGPPRIGDRMARPPEVPKTEPLVCIHCTECGMATPWEAEGRDEKAAMDRCGAVWNRRLNRPEADKSDLQRLVERELGAPDIPLVINLLSRAEGDWNELGPLFRMLAQRLVDATVTTIDSWPIDPVLNDAARFRKLAQLAKWIELEGERYVQFPEVYSPAEDQDLLFEDRIAAAIDLLPDRDRW